MQTIAALLTPPGRAAVAVVSIASDHPLVAEQIVDQLFTPHGRLGKLRPFSQRTDRSIVYGVWDASHEDLVIVRTLRPQLGRSQSGIAESSDRPNATTLQPCLEVHCHGGQVAASAVTDALAERGVSIVSPQDFANQIQSRWVVESEVAICQSETQHTLAHAIRVAQLQPSYLESLRDSVQRGEFPSAIIETGLRWSEFGKHLIEPRSVVLFGKPNVGKSSLINRIVGFQRVIVNPQAGTTRDVVGQKTAIGGWPVILKDTAGIRDASNEIEALGVAKAKAEIESAHLKIAICDATEVDLSDWAATLAFAPEMVVMNKIDLLSNEELESRRKSMEQICQSMDSVTPLLAFVSAGQGIGIDSWIERLGQQLVPSLPDEDQWFPITAWQRETLQSMQRAIAQRDTQTILSLLSR